jgi:hypothetical protein
MTEHMFIFLLICIGLAISFAMLAILIFVPIIIALMQDKPHDPEDSSY